MANLPEATLTIDDAGVSLATGSELLTVISPVSLNADAVPRVYASSQALLDFHGYAPGVDYSAMHMAETKRPILFCGVPIATVGVVGCQDLSNVDGTATISVSGTPLEECDAELTVTKGGTVGTDAIQFELSLDGGETFRVVNLGTATSYVVPFVGITLTFTSGGTLDVDDAFTFRTTAPKLNAAGLTSARTALAAQIGKQSFRWLVASECAVSGDATAIVTEANAYETSNDRYVVARAVARDQYKQAKKARIRVKMTGNPAITFAEVGATGDTITRATGSFVTDGFTNGMYITVSGSVSNNFSHALVTNVTATVLTLDTQDLVAEGPVQGITIIGSTALTFAEVGATGDTITRASGSWLDDGFKVGDVVTVTGTVSNNVTGAIAALSATVLTFDTTDLVAEILGTHAVTVTAPAESKTAWASSTDTNFAGITNQRRITLGRGRGRKLSPILGYAFRRPAHWAASIRENQHDVHIPSWRKADGALNGWSIENDDGTLVEYDARVDGGPGDFTCFRSYSNDAGAFIALDLTRADPNSLLSRTHNMCVVNVACTVTQAETERAIGQVLVLKSDGKGSEESLRSIESRVNTALAINLLQGRTEGPRASSARWTASRNDILNVPGAELNGVLNLLLNGTLEKISTRVRVQTAG